MVLQNSEHTSPNKDDINDTSHSKASDKSHPCNKVEQNSKKGLKSNKKPWEKN